MNKSINDNYIPFYAYQDVSGGPAFLYFEDNVKDLPIKIIKTSKCYKGTSVIPAIHFLTANTNYTVKKKRDWKIVFQNTTGPRFDIEKREVFVPENSWASVIDATQFVIKEIEKEFIKDSISLSYNFIKDIDFSSVRPDQVLGINEIVLKSESEASLLDLLNKHSLLSDNKIKLINVLKQNFLLWHFEYSHISKYYVFENYHNEESVLVFLKDINSGPPFPSTILYVVLSTIKRVRLKTNSDHLLMIYEMVLKKIPLPLILVDFSGELVFCNDKFMEIGLLPAHLKKMEHADVCEKDNRLYLVWKSEFISQGAKYFIYVLPAEINSELLDVNGQSFQALGIISSSLAHELNNPLGGIIMSLAVLKMDLLPDNPLLKELEAIQDAADRAKQLVELFLGLSKNMSSHNGPFGVKECLHQALYLLRFRMMESHVKLNLSIKIINGDTFYGTNYSVITIILYLILNELITSYAHWRLIDADRFTNKEIDCIAELSENSIRILPKSLLPQSSNYEKIKLLKHLLQEEKISFMIQSNGAFVLTRITS